MYKSSKRPGGQVFSTDALLNDPQLGGKLLQKEELLKFIKVKENCKVFLGSFQFMKGSLLLFQAPRADLNLRTKNISLAKLCIHSKSRLEEESIPTCFIFAQSCRSIQRSSMQVYQLCMNPFKLKCKDLSFYLWKKRVQVSSKNEVDWITFVICKLKCRSLMHSRVKQAPLNIVFIIYKAMCEELQ